MSAFLAEVSNGADLAILFVILAVLAFAAAIYCAVTNQFVAAAVAAFIGIIILVVA